MISPDPTDVELAVRAAARARYLDRYPGADQSRVDRYVEGMAVDRMYRVELSAAVAALAEAGRLVPLGAAIPDDAVPPDGQQRVPYVFNLDESTGEVTYREWGADRADD